MIHLLKLLICIIVFIMWVLFCFFVCSETDNTYQPDKWTDISCRAFYSAMFFGVLGFGVMLWKIKLKRKAPFIPCGEGENICNCKNAKECGYLPLLNYEQKQPI